LIYSFEYQADGITGISGATVSARPAWDGAYTDDGGVATVSPYYSSTTTDASGYWELDVAPGLDYIITVTGTRNKEYRVHTPDAGESSQLEDLL
jgi:hypothetical protein